MSYSKKTWVTGETVKAEYLNNMEKGIEDNSTNIASETTRATQAEKSIRDSIPTKTSDLSNDSGYKTTDTNTTYTLTKEGNQIVLNGSDGSKSNVTDNSGTTDLSNYYTKGETYNQEEIDTRHNALVNKTGNQEITGDKNFCGKVSFYDVINDKDDSVGTAGQILSSTGDGVKWINAPTTDLSNYYNKGETYSKIETNGKIDEKVNQKASQSDLNALANRVTTLETNSGGGSAYVRVNERITLSSPSADSNCQTLYIKVGEGMSPGDREPIGYFIDETDVLFYIDGYVEIYGEQFSCDMVETDVYSVVLPNAMSGAYITPETDTSNRAYFVNQVGEETKAPLGKTFGYTLRLERGDVELDINKVYTLDASHWDIQEKPCFVLTDNGEPLKVDKVYTFKVIDFFLPQWVNDEYINIAELFRIKLAGGLTERGSGEGRTFMWSGENGQNYSVNNCHIDKSFDITGIVEITFYTDDTASCYIYLSPFATMEQ